jgi:hypothetical protein
MFGSYEKITGDEIPSLDSRILVLCAGFRLLLQDFGDGGQNSATIAWPLRESCTNGQIPAKLTKIWHNTI